MAAARSPSGVITRFPRTIRSGSGAGLGIGFVVLLRLQAFAEFRQEILRHAAAIAGGGAHIVDGSDLASQRLLRGAQQNWRNRLSAQNVFGFAGAQHRGRYAAERNAEIDDAASIHPGRGREANFGDGLRAASANLAVVLSPASFVARQANGANQLVGTQIELFVAGPETRIRNPSRSSCGDEFQFRAVDKECRRRIGGRRGVGNIAAQRAAILRGDSARFGSRAAEQRKIASQKFVAANFGVGCERAQRYLFGSGLDAAQFRELPNTEKFSM